MGSSTPGDAARKSVDVVLRGDNYTVRELTLDDYGEIENFLRTKYVRLYREFSSGIDPDELHKRTMEILRRDISVEELQEQMDSTDVSLFAAYLTIRDNPGMTFDKARELLDTDTITIVSEAVDGLSGGEEEADPPAADQDDP